MFIHQLVGEKNSMNKEIKKEWVKWLKSGAYDQCRLGLCIQKSDGGYGFCCLGVLTNIYHEEHGTGFSHFGKGYLPDEVSLWAELGTFKQLELVHLNDEKRKSFDEIADYIQENL